MISENAMRTNPYINYLENEILTADPVHLIVLLYRGAIESVAAARTHLANGDIRARSRSITKAIEILTELALTLNFEAGGDLSSKLSALYDYAQRLLVDANIRQVEPPLVEAEQLLSTLLEAWEGCQDKQSETEAPRAEFDSYATAETHHYVSCAC